MHRKQTFVFVGLMIIILSAGCVTRESDAVRPPVSENSREEVQAPSRDALAQAHELAGCYAFAKGTVLARYEPGIWTRAHAVEGGLAVASRSEQGGFDEPLVLTPATEEQVTWVFGTDAGRVQHGVATAYGMDEGVWMGLFRVEGGKGDYVLTGRRHQTALTKVACS